MPLAPINEASPVNRNHPLAQGLELWWAYGSRMPSATAVRNAVGPKYTGSFVVDGASVPNWSVSTPGGPNLINPNIAPYYLASSSLGNITADGVPDCMNLGSTAFTLSGWFRKASTGSRSMMLSSQAVLSSTYNCQPMVGGSSHVIYFTVSNTNAVQYSAGSLSDRSWFFLTIVYDGTQSTNTTRCRMYSNGKELVSTANSGTVPASLPNTVTKVMLFKSYIYTSSSNTGFADLKVHSYAMNEQQVLALYRESLSGNANLLNRVPQRMWVPSAAPSGNRIRRVICGGLV